MERQEEISRRSTISLLVDRVEEELYPSHTSNGDRTYSASWASSRTNERQKSNCILNSAHGHDVVYGTVSVLQQPQNVVNSDKHEQVPQNVSMNFRNIASRNDQVTTRINSGSNDPPKLSLEDAYTRDSHLHGISGYGLKNRGGAFVSQEAIPPLHNPSRFLLPPNNQRLQESLLPLRKCNVASRLRPSLLENVAQVRKVRSIGLPSANNLQKLPEHGSHVQTGLSGSEQTFDSLIGIVLNHPMFPLIFKGVRETTTGKTPVMESRTSQVLLERTVEKAEEHETLCRKMGLPNAQRFMNGVDIFFAVFNAAFKSLQSDVRAPIQGPLHAMICASGQRGGANAVSPTNEFSDHFNCQTTVTPEKRAKPSAAARRRLDNWFTENYKNPYPTPEQKVQLARECGIAIKQVCTLRFTVLRSHTNVCLQIKYYFGNRRMREKRKALSTGKQLGKDKKITKKRVSRENSALAPIEKWKNIVLANERNIAQARRGPETGKKSPDGSCSAMVQ